MKEPRRLLTDTQTSELSRSLLAAGRARREPEGARERVWNAVALGLASSAGGSAVVGSALPSGGAKGTGIALALTKVKLLVVASAIATVAISSAVVVKKNEPAVAPTAAPVLAPAITATSANLVEAPPATIETESASMEAKPTATAKAKPAATMRPTPVTRTATEPDAPRPAASSRLREEAALLQEARSALARGDTALADDKLVDARARFPRGKLVEERAALEIRVANDSGDHRRAASLARAFVDRYPDSPLRAGVEAIARAPENQ